MTNNDEWPPFLAFIPLIGGCDPEHDGLIGLIPEGHFFTLVASLTLFHFQTLIPSVSIPSSYDEKSYFYAHVVLEIIPPTPNLRTHVAQQDPSFQLRFSTSLRLRTIVHSTTLRCEADLNIQHPAPKPCIPLHQDRSATYKHLIR